MTKTMQYGAWDDQAQAWRVGPTDRGTAEQAVRAAGPRAGVYMMVWGGPHRPIDPRHAAREMARERAEADRAARRAALLASFR